MSLSLNQPRPPDCTRCAHIYPRRQMVAGQLVTIEREAHWLGPGGVLERVTAWRCPECGTVTLKTPEVSR